MSIGITGDYMYSKLNQSKESGKSEGLKNKLSSLKPEDASDEEMMEVCKDFEAYLVEKVMKEMKSAMTSGEEEENEYLSYFGEMRFQEYAKQISENGELGLAKQLYESMKRNAVSTEK